MRHIILITGAGKGIGKAIALEFARHTIINPAFRPVLVLSSRTPADLETAAAECRTLGAEAIVIQADISNAAQATGLAETVIGRYGRIDCLINNAGVGRFRPLCELTEEDFDYTIATNLKGTFFLTQKLFPVMEKQRKGHIFFITSIAAEKAFKTSSIYSMTKFAQKGLAEALRLYAKECNVRITNIMPGAVHTPMWGDVPDGMKALMMMPEDIAETVACAYFLPERASVEELVIRPIGGDINE
ncbi:MAG: SDR family oxidoreductase [Chlorobium sp.]|uniref:SDR family oxidoreductase n=1 Tax=Chlorobium sp. TaxID=1095 RepID=UPI0025BBC933|nr:SDR family oxidoreductase [Chlorobium sp.]MCF8383505.1 SDR family oxidoreductase [Chlorobium sp.]